MKSLKLFLLLFPFLARAQESDTLTYFNDRWEKVCCKDSAIFYRIGKYNLGIYDGEVVDYHLSTGKIQMDGEFSNWVRNGFFRWYLPNGKKYSTGNFKNDIFTILNAWDTLGNKIVKNGTGYFRWYNYLTGKVSSEGQYENGKEKGRWITYNDQGLKIEEVDYSDSIMLVKNAWNYSGTKQFVVNGTGKIIDYYKNGIVKYKGEYKDGKREGFWEWYYPNNAVSISVRYANGRMTGVYKYFYDNGMLCKELNFVEDKKNGPVIWYYSNGNVMCKGQYTNDVESGNWEWFLESGMPNGYRDFGKISTK